MSEFKVLIGYLVSVEAALPAPGSLESQLYSLSAARGEVPHAPAKNIISENPSGLVQSIKPEIMFSIFILGGYWGKGFTVRMSLC